MAGYIGSRAVVATSGVERKKTFAITTTTTSLTGLDYTPNHVHVFHNGIRLVDGTDYTATNGTSITLVNAAENGDEVVVVSYGTFSPADTYTKTEADDRYVNASGDTMTGTLSVTGVDRNEDALRVGASSAGTGYGLRIGASGATDPLEIWREHSSGDQMQLSVDYYGRVTMPYQPAAFGRFTTITSPTTNYVVGLSDVTARGGMVVSSNRITVPVSGYYLVHAHQLISTSSSNYFHIRINGTTDTYAYVNVDDTEDEAVQTIVNLSANDYIDFYMTNTSYTWGSTHSSWFVTLLG